MKQNKKLTLQLYTVRTVHITVTTRDKTLKTVEITGVMQDDSLSLKGEKFDHNYSEMVNFSPIRPGTRPGDTWPVILEKVGGEHRALEDGQYVAIVKLVADFKKPVFITFARKDEYDKAFAEFTAVKVALPPIKQVGLKNPTTVVKVSFLWGFFTFEWVKRPKPVGQVLAT